MEKFQQHGRTKMIDDASAPQLLSLTVQIVAALVAKNSTDGAALPGLIRSVHAALSGAGTAVEAPVRPEPAVAAKRSVFPDYIICLEDGKKLKTLKRHLSTAFQLTPEQYRERWDLPKDYPMVAPNYAKQRSMLAKQLGLGRKPAVPVAAPEPAKSAAGSPGGPLRQHKEAAVAPPLASKGMPLRRGPSTQEHSSMFAESARAFQHAEQA